MHAIKTVQYPTYRRNAFNPLNIRRIRVPTASVFLLKILIDSIFSNVSGNIYTYEIKIGFFTIRSYTYAAINHVHEAVVCK